MAEGKSRWTFESGLWLLIAVVSLTTRLIHLDAAPLAADEVREALAAWQAVNGGGLPTGGYSPFLLGANGLLFAVAGTGDTPARLVTALLGGLLPLTPFLLRHRIGRRGALLAGLYLALSPAALFSARHLDGTAVAALGVMLFLGGLIRFAEAGGRRRLLLSAGGLALAVTGGSLAYGMLFSLGLAWLVLAWRWPSAFSFSHLRGHFLAFLTLFALLTALFGTAGGLNLPGLGATGDILASWWARFSPSTAATASPLLLLLVYEPFGLLIGLGGVLVALLRRDRFGTLLGLWAALGMVFLWLMPSRSPLDILGVVLPLALLAGTVGEAIARTWRRGQDLLIETLYGLMVMLLWVHLYLVLAHHAVVGSPTDLALAAMTLSLQALLALAFWLAVQPSVAWRAPVAATGLVLLMLTFSAGWRVSHVRPSDPAELLVVDPTAVEVRDLVETLRELSWQETGTAMMLPFAFESPQDGVLAWYLRDFARAERVEDLRLVEAGREVVVTTQRELSLRGSTEEVAYTGQDFVLSRHWEPRGLECRSESPPTCRALVGWWLFRKTPAPPEPVKWAVLWVR